MNFFIGILQKRRSNKCIKTVSSFLYLFSLHFFLQLLCISYISVTVFRYFARKCFFLTAECSPEKSLILLEILLAEFIQSYTSHTPPDPFSLGHSHVPLHRINQTASKAKRFQINIHAVPSARKKKNVLGNKIARTAAAFVSVPRAKPWEFAKVQLLRCSSCAPFVDEREGILANQRLTMLQNLQVLQALWCYAIALFTNFG